MLSEKLYNPLNKKLPVYLAFIVIVFCIIIYFSKLNSEAKNKTVYKKFIITPSPTFVPTPISTPTLKVEKTGYCLNVPVLMYHHIEPVEEAAKKGHTSLNVDVNYFDKQMKYLIENDYHTVSADSLIDVLTNKKSLGKSVVITADDGYSDIYIYAYPVIKKYNLIMNLMIPTGLMNNPGYLNWDNLKEMSDSGLVNAYDHTWSHFSVNRGDDTKDQMEIMTAKNQLDEHLGKNVRIFAYPYGSENQRIVNLLIKDGFVGAFSTVKGTIQCSGYIYNLRRTRIGNAILSAYGL